jgi:uncharacterized membrane protein YkoI
LLAKLLAGITTKIKVEPYQSTKKYLLSGIALGIAIAIASEMAYAGQELAKYKNVSVIEARAISLQAHPGTITDQEFEKKRGGSDLRYSFNIERGSVTHEVGVDTKTRKMLENKKEVFYPD